MIARHMLLGQEGQIGRISSVTVFLAGIRGAGQKFVQVTLGGFEILDTIGCPAQLLVRNTATRRLVER